MIGSQHPISLIEQARWEMIKIEDYNHPQVNRAITMLDKAIAQLKEES